MLMMMINKLKMVLKLLSIILFALFVDTLFLYELAIHIGLAAPLISHGVAILFLWFITESSKLNKELEERTRKGNSNKYEQKWI